MFQMTDLTAFERVVPFLVIGIAIISLLYAWWLRSGVLKKDKGTAKMQEVWNAIRVGADAYLSRQLRSILPLIAILAVAMFLSVYVVKPSNEASELFGENATIFVAVGRTIAFILVISDNSMPDYWISIVHAQYGIPVAAGVLFPFLPQIYAG